MSKDNLKKVLTEVDEDILISLKILSLKKRISLGQYITDTLTSHVRSKSKQIETAEEV